MEERDRRPDRERGHAPPPQPSGPCQVRGCDRPAAVPTRFREAGTPAPIDPDEDPFDYHYICRFHHRLYLGLKAALLLVLVGLLLVAFFTW